MVGSSVIATTVTSTGRLPRFWIVMRCRPFDDDFERGGPISAACAATAATSTAASAVATSTSPADTEITEVYRPGASDSGSVTRYDTSTDSSGASSNDDGSTTVYAASGPVGLTVTTCAVSSALCSRSARGTAMPGIDVVIAGSSDVLIVIAATVVRPRER